MINVKLIPYLEFYGPNPEPSILVKCVGCGTPGLVTDSVIATCKNCGSAMIHVGEEEPKPTDAKVYTRRNELVKISKEYSRLHRSALELLEADLFTILDTDTPVTLYDGTGATIYYGPCLVLSDLAVAAIEWPSIITDTVEGIMYTDGRVINTEYLYKYSSAEYESDCVVILPVNHAQIAKFGIIKKRCGSNGAAYYVTHEPNKNVDKIFASIDPTIIESARAPFVDMVNKLADVMIDHLQ